MFFFLVCFFFVFFCWYLFFWESVAFGTSTVNVSVCCNVLHQFRDLFTLVMMSFFFALKGMFPLKHYPKIICIPFNFLSYSLSLFLSFSSAPSLSMSFYLSTFISASPPPPFSQTRHRSSFLLRGQLPGGGPPSPVSGDQETSSSGNQCRSLGCRGFFFSTAVGDGQPPERAEGFDGNNCQQFLGV